MELAFLYCKTTPRMDKASKKRPTFLRCKTMPRVDKARNDIEISNETVIVQAPFGVKHNPINEPPI
jgi:hypothetical protein